MKSSLNRLALAMLALSCGLLSSWAQTSPAPPGQLTYQGFLTDANGAPLATNAPKNYTVYFRLWNAATGGTALWGEQQVVTVDRGYFTVMLGAGSAISGVNWTNDLTGFFNAPDASSRYVGTTLTDLSASEIVPRLRLLPAPYSLLSSYAMTASNVVGLNTVSSDNLATNIGIWTVAGPNVYRAAGKVGIGTNAPAENLTIANVPGYDLGLKLTGNGNGTGMALESTATGGHKFALFSAGTGVTAPVGSFSLFDDTAGKYRLTLSSAGNFGINNAAPVFPIDFSETLGDKIALWDTGGSASYGFGVQSALLQIHTDTAGADIAFGSGSSASFTETMRIKGSGYVGIGTSSPVVPLDIATSASYGTSSLLWYYDEYGTGVNFGAWGAPVSVLASGGVTTGYGFFLLSDKRVKKDFVESDSKKDMEMLSRLRVTDFAYIDKVRYGDRRKKGLIAQEVEEVFPEAVTHQTGAVPDIYKRAACHDGWVELATDLKKGERVKLITSKGEDVYEVLEATKDSFRTALKTDDNKVFVFGREVKDLHTVDYDLITALTVSATQELAKREAKLEERESELEQRAARLETVEREVAELKKAMAQLAAPTRNGHIATQTVPQGNAAVETHGSLVAARLEQ